MAPRSPTARNRETVLDSDLIFAVMLITSSLRKTVAWCMTHGIYNPYSGGPFTQPGLYRAAEKSNEFLKFRYRRDVTHELPGEEPDEGEIAWAEKCVEEKLPVVLEHIKVLDARLKALKRLNDIPVTK